MGQFYERLGKELSLFVRQLAWLNTPPKRGKNDKHDPSPRINRMRADNIPIQLPENPAPYIVDWLMEIGPLASGGMGPTALDWTAIQAWCDLTGNDLDPWEARTIRRLSRDFLDQMQKAKEPTCPAPFSEAQSSDGAVTEQFKRLFSAFHRMPKPKKSKSVKVGG